MTAYCLYFELCKLLDENCEIGSFDTDQTVHYVLYAHLYEQFLQFSGLGFGTLGSFHCA